MALISIIMPILNEEEAIGATLNTLKNYPDVEIIVVDGGSTDRSRAIVQQYPCRLVELTQGNRARQMNAGAAIAQGQILLFLHGDTILPKDFAHQLKITLHQPHTVAGAFKLSIDGSNLRLKLVEWGVQWRSRWLQLPYGDQAIFLEKATFETIGGFPDLPIMEDFALVQHLKTLGSIALAPGAVTTSPRRWQRLGVLKTTMINQVMIAGYYLGIDPDRLRQWYRSQS